MRMMLSVCALGILIAAAWIGFHAVYYSWHACDWLLQDTVDRVLERRGADPDTASIPLKAQVSEAPEVQIVLRLHLGQIDALDSAIESWTIASRWRWSPFAPPSSTW